jgi:hypothetical protein
MSDYEIPDYGYYYEIPGTGPYNPERVCVDYLEGTETVAPRTTLRRLRRGLG